MKREVNIMSASLIALAKAGCTVFRQNVGQGWIGQIVKDVTVSGDRYITIKNPRPLRAGLCEGSSDIIGWRNDGVFLAVESKSPTGRATPAQTRFIAAVNRAGGRAGIARSPEEAVAIALAEADQP